jgi:hypothetical protein
VDDLLNLKSEIGQIKEAMDKSLSPGSQSFESACSSWSGTAWSRRKKRWPMPTRPPTCSG